MLNRRNFPERITIELTNSCNLLCSFCPRNNVDMEIGYMDEKLFYKIIDEASKFKPISIVIFFRGESLLHPKIIEMIEYAKSKGIGPVQLASNAQLLTEKLGRDLILSGLDFISFSIDTNDAELYKTSRKNGSLERSRNNIIKFVKKCEEYKQKGIDVPEIQISTVDIDAYKEGKEEFVDFWRKYADRVRIYFEHSKDGVLGSIDKELLNNLVRKPCKKVYTDMVIYWNGNVALCNHDWDNKLNIGNVEEETIESIWNGNQYEKIRKMHEKGNFEDKENIVCKSCDHWKMYYMEQGFLGEVYEKYKKEERENE